MEYSSLCIPNQFVIITPASNQYRQPAYNSTYHVAMEQDRGSLLGQSVRVRLDCPVLLQKAVAAPTTQLGGVRLHRYFNIAVNVTVDVIVYIVLWYGKFR